MQTTLPSGAAATVDDLAHEWNVSGRTVTRLCAEGRLPHHRIGSQIRFTPEDRAAIRDQTLIAPEAS
jgi:excisionase family DNA binding protein